MLTIFFAFRSGFLKKKTKEKKRTSCILTFFSTKFLLKIEYQITLHEFDAQTKPIVLKCFYGNTISAFL